eukprot:CAMPEP_0172298362 /NCGR_PEP_ID=MMETSP1058-20130122/1056_1 /TAXON_ID=83371 /ORGANISM="Detonula confervacea, Strain CCMP 353" /LENGTH=133 /DNA_ID=CAMNT_0013007631 /DNA_START=77 /DNA_END=478 /DNA_ORIENTATION=+
MTETAPQKQQNKAMLFTISQKNETLFKIKQIATGIHFVSLVALGLLYFVEHEQTFNSFIIAATSFVLAMFIPPTGMISTEDAPDYAKNSMSYMPNTDGSEEAVTADRAGSSTEATTTGTAKPKSNKKKSKKKD